MALTFTESDLDNLKAALLTGALRVRIGEREVIYRSQAEILKAIKMISEYIEAQTDTTTSSLVQSSFTKQK